MEHLLITGGEQFLPFARSRVRMLKSLGMAYADQSFEADGCSIKVRIAPNHEYISLSGGAYYQFFSSGPTLTTQKYGIWNWYKGFAVGISKPPAAKPKLYGSSVEGDATMLDARFPVKHMMQMQGITEHKFYPSYNGSLSSSGIASSWSSGRQIEGLSASGGCYRRDLYFTSIDVTYDIPTTIGSKWLAPECDWYKRGAIRTVSHPDFGTRTFAILTDIYCNLHVLPVDADTSEPLDANSESQKNTYASQAIKTNVNSRYVVTKRIPLPGWCREPHPMPSRDLWHSGTTVQDLIRKVPQYRWAFNSTAKKVCGVVFEDLQKFTGNPGTPTEYEPYFLDDSGERQPIRESLPGFVEFDLSVEITGQNLEDFKVDIALSSEIQPTVAKKYILGCDYAWPVGGFTEIDDLVMMIGRIFHKSNQRTGFVNLNAHLSTVDVVNQTAGKVVRSFVTHIDNYAFIAPSQIQIGPNPVYPEPKSKNGDAIFMAIDLRVLAFVVRQKYREFNMTWATPTFGGRERDGLAACRIQTYMRNALVDEVIMEPLPSATDTALVDMFASADTSDMYEMPVDELGMLSFYISPGVGNGYETLPLGGPDSPYVGYPNIGGENGAQVSAGAFLYSYYLAPRIAMTRRSIFAVHPGGSWSISTPPVMYFPGPLVYGPSGTYDIANSFDPSSMRSALVDHVVFSVPGKDPVKTSHIELLNKATGKDYKAAEFLPRFEKRTITQGSTVRTFLVDASSTRVFELEQKTGSSYYFDLVRPLDFDFQTQSTQLWDFYAGTATSETDDKTPVIGGSALFI